MTCSGVLSAFQLLTLPWIRAEKGLKSPQGQLFLIPSCLGMVCGVGVTSTQNVLEEGRK
jgi:hypothetical protein